MEELTVKRVQEVAQEFGMLLSVKHAQEWIEDIMQYVKECGGKKDPEDVLYISMRDEAQYWELDSREAEEFERDRW